MVLSNHIAEAERNGMPEDKVEVRRCRQCDAKRTDEDIDKCDECGHECCPKCWYWIPDIALRFCGKECAITKLLKLLEIAELGKPITEHPDVQRLIGQVVELQAENKRLVKERDKWKFGYAEALITSNGLCDKIKRLKVMNGRKWEALRQIAELPYEGSGSQTYRGIAEQALEERTT